MKKGEGPEAPPRRETSTLKCTEVHFATIDMNTKGNQTILQQRFSLANFRNTSLPDRQSSSTRRPCCPSLKCFDGKIHAVHRLANSLSSRGALHRPKRMLQLRSHRKQLLWGSRRTAAPWGAGRRPECRLKGGGCCATYKNHQCGLEGSCGLPAVGRGLAK